MSQQHLLSIASSANLQTVADAAGVHRSTASRALNPATAHLVATSVADRIQSIARDLGYRADPVAAGLRTRRSRLVGIVVPDIANPVFGPILGGIEEALSEGGYSMLVANAGGDAAHQMHVVRELMRRRVDGLVLATARTDDPILTQCLAAAIPTVLVNRAETARRVSSVVTNDVLGLQLAVEHLVAQGHRRIAHLAGPQDLSTGQLRLRGYLETLQTLGVPSGPVVVATHYTREAGAAAAAQILTDPAVTAIAAANDLLALGAYQAIAARGLTCPNDVSVTGHNDMPLADMVSPPLTTIRIRPNELGRAAATLLIAAIETPNAGPVTRMAEPLLVVRGSTRRLES